MKSPGSQLKEEARDMGAGHRVSCKKDYRGGLRRSLRASLGKMDPYAEAGSSKPRKNEELHQKYQ